LGELTARLCGDMAAAGVYRLQTEFGGGKTHTLLAAYHLFRDPTLVADTPFVRELADRLHRSGFPKAAVVVLEGGALPAGEPDSDIKDAEVWTLLGQIAYRLGGLEGFAKVAEQDRELHGSSTTQLAELLEAHSPCLILLDEVLQYLAKALAVSSNDGNLAATSLTFIKELCAAAASVPGVAVMATLNVVEPRGLCERHGRGDARAPLKGRRAHRRTSSRRWRATTSSRFCIGGSSPESAPRKTADGSPRPMPTGTSLSATLCPGTIGRRAIAIGWSQHSRSTRSSSTSSPIAGARSGSVTTRACQRDDARRQGVGRCGESAAYGHLLVGGHLLKTCATRVSLAEPQRGVRLAAQLRLVRKRASDHRSVDPLLQRASSPSGARLSECTPVPGSTTTGGGLRCGKHYLVVIEACQEARASGVGQPGSRSTRRRSGRLGRAQPG